MKWIMKANFNRTLFVGILLVCCGVGPNLTWRFKLEWMQFDLPLRTTIDYAQTPNAKDYEVIHEMKNSTLLMVQYSGGNTYSLLLNLTQQINVAYANMWGFDYKLFTGLMIQSEIPASTKNTMTNIPESRATYNKVMILEKILLDKEYRHYDKLLILDSDALMYDFSRDISSLVPDDRSFVAHKVRQNDSDTTQNINIGVTLWNLRHIATLPICRAWKKASLQRIMEFPSKRDSDQTPLQSILKRIPEDNRRKIFLAISDELGHGDGKFVRHFIRPNCKDWTDNNNTMPIRINKVRNTIADICNRTFSASIHPSICTEFISV